MATTPSSFLLDEPEVCPVFDDALQACPETLSRLYNLHYRHVLRVCRKYFRRPEDAEDAAAEVFMKLRTVLRQKNEFLPFRPWISQVARRYCIDKLRKMRLEHAASVEGIEVTEFPDPSSQSPLSRVLQDEDKRLVKNLLSSLPEYYRIPLVLRYYKEMSYSEIAHQLNRGLPAVRCMIFRAKNRLRRSLSLAPDYQGIR
jgi:RNA polymerase sigma-70 factor, ECF subfamily